MKNINLKKEAEEYFSHNPEEESVGFALLNADQLLQAENCDEITGEIDVLDIANNKRVKKNRTMFKYITSIHFESDTPVADDDMGMGKINQILAEVMEGFEFKFVGETGWCKGICLVNKVETLSDGAYHVPDC